MRWLGLFTWNVTESLACAFPPALWTEERATIGGAERSGGGVLAGYVVREDQRLHLPLRILADEWPGLRALQAWAETGAEFEWMPDIDHPDVAFTVTLDSPRAGESLFPSPDSQYPRVRLVTLVLRRADGQPFDLDYFSELAES